jgi:hypothetical protein
LVGLRHHDHDRLLAAGLDHFELVGDGRTR